MISVYQQKLKDKLMQKCRIINEGISHHGSSTLLNEIYTELYITEGGSGDVNNEHEVRQIETASRRPATQETPIKCNDIFKDKPIRTVLTQGVAGIGKTVSVQKFILDWAEGKANQDVLFIFPLPFRELNLMKEKKFSLMDLLHHFFPETKQLQLIDCDAYKVIFIFDGLDECRLPLDFQNNERLFDVTKSTCVDVLLTNLIMRNLLPSALLWITSRPAAASQIPPECVDLVTEVRGFSDLQKEEYFRKRISDQILANRIISHMKSSRSLYIMCHIPVFCWIAATVLERMLGEAESGEIPKTLTQMFTHFLIFQIKHKDRKYQDKTDPDPHQTRSIVMALGKLAFQQLEKGNLIFYEEDLRECGIDVKEVSVYSGVCTQIFREESVLHLGKVFSFVHLSVQEFLAALYAFLSFINNNTNMLENQNKRFFKRPTMSNFLMDAVDKALETENGHLDLFLRFLLGLSLESNQTLLRDIKIQTGSCSHVKEETIFYIKEMIKKNPSSEKSTNLFHCLNELKDDSLVQEVQTYMNRGGNCRLPGARLSPAEWSTLVFVLLNLELDEFDLSKYGSSEECLLRLLPVVTASRKADLSGCSIREEGCAALCSALRSNPSSHLRELNLNYNDPGDSGVKQLSSLLEDPHCKLEILQLSFCSITKEGCAALCSALRSNPSSHLIELNLTYNELGDSGVKQLSAVLEDSYCKLEKLQLSDCGIREEGCAALCSALCSSHLRELNLNNNNPGDSGVKQLSALLEDPHCKLEKLQLSDCGIREEGCAALCLALRSNPSSHLRELNLTYNNPGDLVVKRLSALLEDPLCKLEKLQLSGCSITEEGCAALCSALRSNPSSHLRELNLNYNQLGDSGVKQLSGLLEDPHCNLEKLQLSDCGIREEGCAALCLALRSNPSSHLRQLNLNYNQLGDSGVNWLSALLEDPLCKLEKLHLSHCSITEEGCAALCSALRSNPSSHLRELNLNDNEPGDSVLKQLSALLEDPHCRLQKLLYSHKAPIQKSRDTMRSFLRTKGHQRDRLSQKRIYRDSGTKHHRILDKEHHLKHCEVFIPEKTEKGSEVKNSNSYRFMVPHAGLFQCKLTNLVFKMEGKGEVMYRLVSWDIHLLDGLSHMQPIGPLYDIDSISGSISQLHLPHCEIMHEERKDQMAVAHFTGDNVEVIQPLQVTNTHVIIDVRGLSLFGSLLNRIFGSSPINGQVLLFYKEITDTYTKLHIHLLPWNVPVDEVMNRQINFRNIPTSSKCQLIPGRKYRPFCKHTFQPEDETFDRDYGPNYHPTFEVFLDAKVKEITIGLLDEEGKQVWAPRLVLLTDQCEPAQTIRDQSDPGQTTTAQSDPAQTTTAQSDPAQTTTAQSDPGQTITAQSDLDQTITARSGGSVNAPALSSSVFNAPVNITFGDNSRHKGK
ncbi:NACHT, LRR and PYD domains-containing protein 3-like isoform X2 [Brachyhypopomus gauderio]|uniref:NACHT, LRR and PYD domains-containing protein 3-like isoform X2 n=1 Tax=Brachyhypopomus gauderio TaxID=698409 RepID=UPI0040426A71